MSKEKAATLDLPTTGDQSADRSDRNASTLDRWLARKVLESLGSPPISIVLWNGDEIRAQPRSTIGKALIHDRSAFYQLLRNPALHFGDLYSVGRIEVDGDLIQFLEAAYHGQNDANNHDWLKKLYIAVQRRPRANSLAGSASISSIITISATLSTSSGSIRRCNTPVLTSPIRP